MFSVVFLKYSLNFRGSFSLRLLFLCGFSYEIMSENILFIKNKTIIWPFIYNKRPGAVKDENWHSCISGLKLL